MAIIQPNSTIILYSGMPLDSDYNDTLYFETLAAQTTFFQGNYIRHTLTANTYQRVNSGVFDANLLADLCYNCNYMAFQNTNFGQKWFYAFIDKVEYVNNGNARIYYTIDVMQTWFFDITLKRSMILRQHASADPVGGNIEPEPVTLGEYTIDDAASVVPDAQTVDFESLDCCVMWVDGGTGASVPVSGVMLDNVFCGCKITAFDMSQEGAVDNLRNFIATTATGNLQRPEAIVAIYMSPHWITQGSLHGYMISDFTTNNIQQFTVPIKNDYEEIVNGFRVRNKKLMTYPYSFIQINTYDGKAMALRYEFFDKEVFNGQCKLSIYGSAVPPIQLSVAPLNYKGNPVSNVQHVESIPVTTEAMSCGNFPLCSWTYDTFRAWLAQNALPMAVSAGTSIAMTALTGGLGGGALVGSLTNIFNETYTASIQADTVKGDTQSGNAAFSAGFLGFQYQRMAINQQQLIHLDQFFDMYGYAQNRYGVPNRDARLHYTFVQTEKCCAVGQCPTEDLKKVKSIYDRGVRFWKHANEVGNYGVANTPNSEL